MEKEKQKKYRGGRPSISKLLKRKKFGLYLTIEERKALEFSQKQLGYTSLSEYLRVVCLRKNEKIIAVNPVELLARMDKLGGELNKIGSNFNQIAKYANQFSNQGKYDADILKSFNEKFDDYKELSKEVTRAYANIVSNI